VVLPILGASDVRDAIGRLGDDFTTPRQYLRNPYWDYGLFLLDELDVRARLLDYDHLIDGAYDPYAFLRNAYLQRRDFKVNGSTAASQEEEQEQKLMDEAAEDAGASDTATPAPQGAPAQPPPETSPPKPQ